jgi:hypothetical protein
LLNQIAAIHNSGAVPFNVLSLPNLKLWLDASDTSSITSSAGAVSAWNDKSGNGYNFAQATATNKPTTGTRSKNGLNVIDFDGTNDFMQNTAAASVFNFMHNTTGATVFITWSPDTIATNNWILDSTNSDSLGSSGYGTAIYSQNTSAEMRQSTNNGSGNPSTAPIRNNGGPTVAGSTWYYITLKADTNNATAGNRSLYRRNGGADTGTNTNTGTPSATNASQALVLGAQAAGAFEPLNGMVAEIIICSGILSATDITNTQNYLAAKWAI